MQRKKRGVRNSPRHPVRIEFARDQRAQANEFSRAVWDSLRARRKRGQKFRREHPIPPYTVDFVCVKLKLIAEVDGEQHFTEHGRRQDAKRDQYLRALGYTVVRIEGYQTVKDMAGVMRAIEHAIEELQ